MQTQLYVCYSSNSDTLINLAYLFCIPHRRHIGHPLSSTDHQDIDILTGNPIHKTFPGHRREDIHHMFRKLDHQGR